MPTTDPPTCTTLPTCEAPATHEVIGSAKIRGLPARAGADPVRLFTCEGHLRLAADRVRSREARSIRRLPEPQPNLFDDL